MENPNTIIEIHDAKSYAMNSEFADKVCLEVNTINHQDIIANARD